jgi:hypothetical protein
LEEGIRAAYKNRERDFKYPRPTGKPQTKQHCNNGTSHRDNITTNHTDKQQQVTNNNTAHVINKDTRGHEHSRRFLLESKTLPKHQGHNNGKTTHQHTTLRTLNQSQLPSPINLTILTNTTPKTGTMLNNQGNQQQLARNNTSNGDRSRSSRNMSEIKPMRKKTNQLIDQTLIKPTIGHQKMNSPPTRRAAQTNTIDQLLDQRNHQNETIRPKQTASCTGFPKHAQMLNTNKQQGEMGDMSFKVETAIAGHVQEQMPGSVEVTTRNKGTVGKTKKGTGSNHNDLVTAKANSFPIGYSGRKIFSVIQTFNSAQRSNKGSR